MSRRQARIDRKNEALLRQQEKTARLVEVVKSDQAPRSAFAVNDDKSPRASANPNSIMQMQMSYRILDYSDRDGEWTWGEKRNWCGTEHGPQNACMVRATMIEMSGLKWSEIFAKTTGGRDRHKKHHSHSFETICDEAQSRWIEIGREEDTLFRFRTGGKQRIWGFRTGAVFNVVWWDAQHKIYPVD